jgi:hypothetical protein
MPIDYCRIEGGNFGDDLNCTLWRNIFPDIDRLAPDITVSGIGTLLSDKPSAKRRSIILGSGADGPNVKINVNNSDIRWVRGPHSAAAVRAKSSFGIGDPAWLYPDLYQTLDAGRPGITGLIPHWATWRSFDWAGVANQAGMMGIDARLPPAQIVEKMRGCTRILTESLHGAVFADAMGIPWAPAVFAHRFHRFKWEDWSASIHRKFDPFVADRPLVNFVSPIKSLVNRIARKVDFHALTRYPSMRAVKAVAPDDAERVAAQMAVYCANDAHFICSDPFFVKAQKAKMLEACAAFARDYGLSFQPEAAAPLRPTNPLRPINHKEIKPYFVSNSSNYVWD